MADWRADYAVLNGQAFPNVNDTFDDLAADQEEAEASGIVDTYVVSQNISETTVGADDGDGVVRRGGPGHSSMRTMPRSFSPQPGPCSKAMGTPRSRS